MAGTLLPSGKCSVWLNLSLSLGNGPQLAFDQRTVACGVVFRALLKTRSTAVTPYNSNSALIEPSLVTVLSRRRV